MKKLVFTTAVALVLATAAYAQDHMRAGGGGGGAPSAGASHGPSGGGGPGPGNFSAQRGPSGPSAVGPSNMGPSNRSQTMNGPTTNGPKTGGQQFNNRFSDRDRLNDRDRFSDRTRFSDRDQRLYNRYDRDDVRGDWDRNVQGDWRHRGVVRGNFFEHGRHFGFRRFWHGQWVFLNAWDDCTAFVWVHVAPGVWAWRPIDVCIG